MPGLSSLLLILLLASLSFGLCMAALGLRRDYGLAPLMLVMGLLEGLKYHAAAAINLNIPALGPVSLGSLVSYINLLAVMQVVHLRLGPTSARQLAWGLVALSIVSGLLHPLLALLLDQPDIELGMALDRRLLVFGAWVQGVGNVLLLMGLVGSVLLVEFLRQRRWPLWLALVLSLLVVTQLDTVLFLGLAFGPSALTHEALAANAVGKGVMALVFGAMAALALRDLREEAEPNPSLRRLRELLGAFSFQHRVEALELELQTDPLTGLFNRRYLERVVPDILRIERDRGQPSCLCILDLDHFKAVNDGHGHLAGDELLRHVANLLRQQLRRQDSVLRFGGEEFLLVLPSTSQAEAVAVVEQLLGLLRTRPLALSSGLELQVTATAGLACTPQDGQTVQVLLQRADERLYEGKRNGRDRLVSGAPR
ncbi:MAG: diguanylate cyclase [Burkholderiales bacterium]